MSNKHTKQDLIQMQSLPLQAKIRMSKRRIRDWYERYDGKVYVSYSGGKDSTVLKHLVEQTIQECYGETVPSLFVNTGLEYPEIQKFAMNSKNVQTVRPALRFDDVIIKYGYPVSSKETSKRIYELRHHNLSDKYRLRLLNGDENGRGKIPKKWMKLLEAPFEVSSKCCDIMKKGPAKRYQKETGRTPYIGTMAEESQLRYTSWIKHGCNAFDLKGQPQSRPMMFWTENDVLEYIYTTGIEYCSIYGNIVQEDVQADIFGNEKVIYKTTGAKRTGCMFCMYGMGQDGKVNRFQKMKQTHPIQYNYCMKPVEEGGLGLKNVLDYIGEKYE